MQIDEWTLRTALGVPAPDTQQVGWFAARQPGLFRFLEERLGGGTEAFGVAVDAAWRVARVFETRDGAAPRRVDHQVLERAEASICDEASMRVVHGCVARQPILLDWIAEHFSRPPIPLEADDARTASTSVAAFAYALDEVVNGRALP